VKTAASAFIMFSALAAEVASAYGSFDDINVLALGELKAELFHNRSASLAEWATVFDLQSESQGASNRPSIDTSLQIQIGSYNIDTSILLNKTEWLHGEHINASMWALQCAEPGWPLSHEVIYMQLGLLESTYGTGKYNDIMKRSLWSRWSSRVKKIIFPTNSTPAGDKDGNQQRGEHWICVEVSVKLALRGGFWLPTATAVTVHNSLTVLEYKRNNNELRGMLKMFGLIDSKDTIGPITSKGKQQDDGSTCGVYAVFFAAQFSHPSLRMGENMKDEQTMRNTLYAVLVRASRITGDDAQTQLENKRKEINKRLTLYKTAWGTDGDTNL